MNYSCEYQTEVQSALWSRGSVTLFTAATIHKGECKTYLVCSDTKEKEKNTVAAFLRYLYESKLAPTSKEMASVEEVIWSDGPSSEFKNKFMVHLLQQLSNKYSKKFSWKYTATSHGKGVVDGIGGRAKSLVHTAVMSRGHMAPIVQTAEDFVKLITMLMPSTQSILITEADIPREEAAWVDIPVIQGIKQFHVIKASPGEPLQFFYNAMHPVATANITDMEGEAERYKVGDWVLVRYDIQLYPGEIMDILEDEYEVKVMTKAAGNRWKWPAAEDKLWYTINNVMKKILPPEVVGSRGQFVFHSDDLSV